MKTYKPMRTPQGYSYQLNAINTGLENIDYEIWEFIGKGDINQIDFKQNIVPSFVQKKIFGYVSRPDFRTSMLLSGVHSLSLDFSVYHEELSFLINNEMKKSVPDLFVMEMLEGMKKYRQLYKEKEKQCSLLPELIAYYQTGNNPYWILSDGKASPRWDGVTGYFRSLDYSCKEFFKIADYYQNKQAIQTNEYTSKDESSVDIFISLADEAITLYETYKVRNYNIDGLESIKQLQENVQSFLPKSIESELTNDYPNVEQLKRRIDFIEMKLNGHLVDATICDTDLLGDGGLREKFFSEKMGEKDGKEYTIRLHSILVFLSKYSCMIVEMIGRLKTFDNPPPQKKGRILKEDSLKEYFTLTFKGGGNSSTKINYFTEYLLPDLEIDRNDKDFARIAYLIYDSGKLIKTMRPKTFKQWYSIFCDLVGCKYNANYKPSNLNIGDEFKKSFNYL